MTDKEMLHLFSKGEIIAEILKMEDKELIEKFRIVLERNYLAKLEEINERRTNYNRSEESAVKSLTTLNRVYEKVEKVYIELKEKRE